jgi:hypothetical protein
MRNRRVAGRAVAILVAVFAALSVTGLITTIAASAFPVDAPDAYGEVPIPGATTVYLPAGQVSASLRVRSGGQSVPPLSLDAVGPGGVRPEVLDAPGARVAEEGRVSRQVWVLRVPAEGGYRVEVDGPVEGMDEPWLTFGADTGVDRALWAFVALTVLSVYLAIVVRRRRRAGPSCTGP